MYIIHKAKIIAKNSVNELQLAMVIETKHQKLTQKGIVFINLLQQFTTMKIWADRLNQKQKREELIPEEGKPPKPNKATYEPLETGNWKPTLLRNKFRKDYPRTLREHHLTAQWSSPTCLQVNIRWITRLRDNQCCTPHWIFLWLAINLSFSVVSICVDNFWCEICVVSLRQFIID